MKYHFAKIIFLSTILFGIISSCSEDEVIIPNTHTPKNKVITHIKETSSCELDSDGNPIIEIEEANFKYDETYQKLKSIEATVIFPLLGTFKSIVFI